MNRAFLPFLTLLLTILWATQGQAQTTVYSPDHCDFTVSFPKPYKTTTVSPKEGLDLPVAQFQDVSITEMSLLAIQVSCLPADPQKLAQFDQTMMEQTVVNGISTIGLDEHEVSYVDYGNAKHAMASGYKMMDGKPLIHFSHFLVGEKTVMTFEGNLIGAQSSMSDKLRNIVNSIQVK